MTPGASVVPATAAQNRVLRRLVRLLALVLVVGAVAFAAFYVVDQHVNPGPTLAQRAISETETQVRANPDNLGLRLKLAAAYLAAKRSVDAMSQYDAVLLVTPDNAPALLGKAGILDATGDPSSAKPLYQKVVDLRKDGEMAAADSDLQHAFYGVGITSNELGKYSDAIAALEGAVRIDGTDADAWYALGIAQLNGGTPQQAIAAERNAVVFVPLEWADPYKIMEQAYTKLGKPANAAWAHAMQDMVAKRYDVAKAQLQPLVDGPAAADATLALGFAAEAQGDAAGALDWYKKALALDPSSQSAASGVSRLGGASPSASAAASASPAGS